MAMGIGIATKRFVAGQNVWDLFYDDQKVGEIFKTSEGYHVRFNLELGLAHAQDKTIQPYLSGAVDYIEEYNQAQLSCFNPTLSRMNQQATS